LFGSKEPKNGWKLFIERGSGKGMECYSICHGRVVYETLNMEVIAIDFETGNYYALARVAKQIWQMIEQKMSLDQIARVVSDLYGLDLVKAHEDLSVFVKQLLEHGLIERSDESGDPISISSFSLPYEPPKVQVYTDVQNLLLLDPIHEATEAGWPEVKTH
jgi:hypothetical protein